MDWGPLEWQAVMTIIEAPISLATLALVLYLRANFATHNELGALDTRIDEVNAALAKLTGRVGIVEHELAQTPGATSMAELREDYERMAGDHRVLAEQIAGVREDLSIIRSSVGRLEDWMMRGGK